METALGSSLALDVKASAVALARVALELGIRPWRVGVRGLLETKGDLDAAGDIRIRHYGIEGLVGADVYGSRELTLSLLLGAGIDMLAVSTSNFSRPGPGLLLEPNVAAGWRGEWRVLKNLGLCAALDGVVALHGERFLSDLYTVSPTPRARARISIGALWHLF